MKLFPLRYRYDSIWFIEFKMDYSFDSNGSCTIIIVYMGMGSDDSELVETDRVEYNYDENRNLVQVIYSSNGRKLFKDLKYF